MNNSNKKKIAKGKLWMQLAFFLVFPIIILSLPVNYFDSGQSISLFACFGVEDLVYSTGMTRATMHLIHLDFSGACAYNKLSFVVLPLVLWLYFQYLLKTCFSLWPELRKYTKG